MDTLRLRAVRRLDGRTAGLLAAAAVVLGGAVGCVGTLVGGDAGDGARADARDGTGGDGALDAGRVDGGPIPFDGGPTGDAAAPDGGDVRDGTGSDGGEDACGSTGIAVQGVLPNVLIVLDRSGSMRERLDGSDPGIDVQPPVSDSKWAIAERVLGRALTTYANRIRWGLMVYPSAAGASGGDACEPGDTEAPQVQPAGGTSAGISALLAARQTTTWDNRGSGTPIARALELARTGSAPLLEANRQNYVLLVTDGQETCVDADRTETLRARVQALRALPSMVRTAVVGFGGAVSATDLDAMAVEGGLARPAGAATRYYDASDEATFDAALASIAAAAVSCTFRLQSAPPDANRLFVSADGAMLPRDPSRANGWDYDAAANTVTFYGPPCERVRAGQTTNIGVVYGCPQVVPQCTPTDEACDGIDNDCDGAVDDSCIPG